MKKISSCPVCSRRCAMELTVENGEPVSLRPKVSEGFEGCSQLCSKGVRAIDYRNRPDRVLSPLRRVGERGEGRFEAISWDEAIEEISRRLLDIRSAHGADVVSFFTGYTKWYRPVFRRFAAFFGSKNYATESSSCQRSCVMANICDTGFQSAPDYKNTGVILATARRRFPPPLKAAVERGAKLIVVDPGLSPEIEKYASLHLRPRPGTDIALACGIASELIVSGKADMDYIARHVKGWEEYSARVMLFGLEKTAAITGVPASQISEAARMIGENLPMSLLEGFTGLIHHRNGMQAVRAWDALCALTGSYGLPGGNLPVGRLCADGHVETPIRSFELAHPFPTELSDSIGGRRFPLWAALLDECQAMDYPEAFRRGELKAIFALGFNARMFPNSQGIFEMLKKLDFFVDCDVWLSDSAKYADIVLPAAVSFEREQLAFLAFDSKLWLQEKAVEPLGLARSDEDIICSLARAMKLGDPVLEGGPEKCWEFMLEGSGISLGTLRTAAAPVEIPRVPAPKPLEEGFATASGKFELVSSRIEGLEGLDALPDFIEPLGDQDSEEYPLCLMSGVRTDSYTHALHSRTHDVASIRALREEAALDIHPSDAETLGLTEGMRVKLETPYGAIETGLRLDGGLLPGCVNMYHGYREADVNTLYPADYLDPYSGFPGYKAIACRVRKA